MRRSGAWIVGASAAVALGLVLIATSFTLNSTQEEGITVPNHAYQAFVSPTFLSGKVNGSFSVHSGKQINASVFDGPEYKKFVDFGLGKPIKEVRGNNSTFDASLDRIGRLYVVFINDDNSSIYLIVHFEVTGLSLDVFFAIIALFVAGAAFAVLARFAHRRELLSPPRKPV